MTPGGEIVRITSRRIPLDLEFGWDEVGGQGGLLCSEEQSCSPECYTWKAETKKTQKSQKSRCFTVFTFIFVRKKVKRKGGKERKEWENS